jgi:glycosyltransferase involved in cell wall biosynthesis
MVVPSIWPEPFGIVAAEAMMRARPVVCSNRGGLPEIVTDGICGYIVDPSDLEQMSDRVLEFWNSTKKCRSFGLQGRKRALESFTQEPCYERLQNMYCDALRA